MITSSVVRHGSRLSALALAVGVLAAGCTSGKADKAGGSTDRVTLRLADFDSVAGGLGVARFVQLVGQLSGGELRIVDVPKWGGSGPDAEQRVVRDVSAGKADLGYVGTRVFDTLGLKSFQALTAPMLIDSYPLEKAVIASGIPPQMLHGLTTLHLTGLAVLGDGLRKPIAVAGPLLGPEDWSGVTFGSARSDGQTASVKALGAKPTEAWGAALDGSLAKGTVLGAENNLLVYENGGREALAPYVTANVNLWPRTLVLLANPARLARVTDQQRGWLQRAAREAAIQSTGLFNDQPIVATVCQQGARFADASDADLLALRAAFSPVYASLEQDPQTKAFIAQIEQLKNSTEAEPTLDIPAGCTGPSPNHRVFAEGAVPTELNGTYRKTLTKADALTYGLPNDRKPENLATFPSTFTMILADGMVTVTHREVDGQFEDSHPGDSYSVDGNKISFNDGGIVETSTYAVDGEGNLHLVPDPAMDPGSAWVTGTHPWTKIAGPRPAGAIPDGTYRANLSVAFLVAHGIDRPDAVNNAGLQDIIINGISFTNHAHRPDWVDAVGTVSYAGHRVSMYWNDGSGLGFDALWSLQDGQLRLTDFRPDGPWSRAFWGGLPWNEVG